jgi:Tol biopolymer transport system component
MSADGQHVSFDGPSTNLVTGDTNGFYDVFLYDRTTATVERVSVASGGTQANGPSFVSSTSSDGRYVAFESEATNLVAIDANGNDKDVFVRDRQSGTTSIVSVSSGGTQGDDQSRAPTITPDGRYVAFWSFATNLVAGDTNGRGDIFVRDRQNGTTDIASVATGGILENNSALYPPAISADGRYVAFLSYATNLVAGDTNGSIDVFVHDRQNGTTERVSVDSSGAQGNADCYAPLAISADGRYVAFASDASNLVAGDTNNSTDVFLRDRQNGTTVRVSVGAGGAQANSGGSSPAISADGRYVAFSSDSTNLVAGDTNGTTDVFLRDRLAGTTERVSLANNGSQGNGGSSAPSISSDGRVVAFESGAANLVPNDANGTGDVFLRDRGTTSAFAAFCAGDGTLAPCPCGNSGAVAHGCENSSTTGGALLTASGVASLFADTVSLTSSGEKPTATSVLLQGTLAIAPIHYGDGLRCVGGTLKRLYSHNAAGGIVTMPQGTDLPISAASAAKGDVITAGSTRCYQIYYRDPSTTFCPTPNGSTFNISSAILVAWGS